MTKFLSMLAAILCLMPSAAAAQQVVHVIDGDTLDLDGRRIRLANMDAPESRQKCRGASGKLYDCGQAATNALRAMTLAGPLICKGNQFDRDKRLIAHCFVNGNDLGEAMILQGWARAFLKYGDEYLAQEQLAKKAGLGLWAGDHEAPWEVRPVRGVPAPQIAPDPTCMIKGNINAKGDRIYHMPHSRHYDRTRIDEARRERWFCDESEAIDNGWRPARR